MEFAGDALPLSDADIAAAAAQLGLDPALIAAVAQVESSGGGFLADKRPKILFERHVFSRLTEHRFDDAAPDISNRTPGGYGASGAHQYDRLARAIALDRDAALRSASWGRFQVMGFNCETVGFADVESFVKAMMQSEAEHLAAMIAFCEHNDLIADLEAQDWKGFTAGYNGTGNVAEYSAKLAAAYDEQVAIWEAKEGVAVAAIDEPQAADEPAANGDTDVDDREFARSLGMIIQQVLVAAGEDIKVDGILGPASRAAFDALASRT
jgi:hypothetical protein